MMSENTPHAPVCSLDTLFPDLTSWEEALHTLRVELDNDVDSHPQANGPAVFSWLQLLDRWQRMQGRLSTYIGVQSFVDGRNVLWQTKSAQLRESAAKIGRRQAVFNALLVSTKPADWQAWCISAPALAVYSGRYHLAQRGRHHILAPAVEDALAALDSSLQLPIQLHRRIKAGDLHFNVVEDRNGKTWPFSLSQFEKRFETSADPVLRSNAARVFAAAVRPYRHAFSSAYAGEVARQVSLARLRGFDNTMDYLFWLQGIDRRFFDAQRQALNAGLPPLMWRFADIKRRLLGLERLAFHDLKAYPEQVPTDIEFSYARDAIISAGHRLGDDYANVLRQAFDEGWIEYGQQPNKADSSGCASPFGPHPYVLMTWTGSPRDMFLLAHELGHAVHFHWSAQYQPVLNAAPLRYFIEAPSTLNELLLAEYLLKDANECLRFSTVFELLNSYYHNFVTHYLESEFQVRVYQEADAGRVPGTDALEKIKLEVLRTFWGESVDIDDDAALTWLRQHHYYMGLYPYTYAAGQSIATLYLSRLNNDPAAAPLWCSTLRRGSEQDAASLLEDLDLDLRNPASFTTVLTVIESYINLLEQLAQPYLNKGEIL